MPYPSKYTPQAAITARAYAEQAKPFPSLRRLADLLGIDRRTVHRWRDKHPTFALALQAVEARQRHWQHQLTVEEYRERLEEIDRGLAVHRLT